MNDNESLRERHVLSVPAGAITAVRARSPAARPVTANHLITAADQCQWLAPPLRRFVPCPTSWGRHQRYPNLKDVQNGLPNLPDQPCGFWRPCKVLANGLYIRGADARIRLAADSCFRQPRYAGRPNLLNYVASREHVARGTSNRQPITVKGTP